MKTKYYLLLTILFIVIIFAISCTSQQQKSETPSIEKKSPSEIKQTRDDFGCFSSSCSSIPDPYGKQQCEDWKAGKQVQWPPDCSMMQYGPCIMLCEAEKKAGTQSGSPKTTSAPAKKQVFNVLPSLVKAEFADGVTEEDKNFVIQGISAMDFYLQKWFGKSINQPAGLKVNAVESTDLGSGAQVVMEDGKMVILIGTKSWVWKQYIQINELMGGESHPHVSAHEYVHVYQLHNGCGSVAGDTYVAPKWFTEGEAEWLSHKVTQEAGWVPSFSIPQMNIPQAKQQTGLLKSFESKEGFGVALYAFYTMAVDYLMKDKPIKALDDFCANLAGGKGMSMPEAFDKAFGISLEKFYGDFESYRKTWSSKSSSSQGQIPQEYQKFSESSVQQEKPTGIPTNDPETGSVYIYISDQASCVERCDIYSHIDSRVIRIDDMTGKNWISFGTFGKEIGQLHDPSHLVVGPDGKLYLADKGNNRIVRIDDMTGKGWTTYDVKGQFGESLAVAFDSKGRIYIAASGQIIRIDDMTGKDFTTFGTGGSGLNQFYKLKDIAIDPMDRIYGVDAGNNRIVRIDDMTGKGWVTFGTKGNGVGQFEDESNGVTLDAQGRIYIADEHNNRIVRFDDMTIKGWVEFRGLPNDPLNEPHDIAIMKTGHIYILDTVNHRVVRVDDMTGKGWIAFAPDAKNTQPEKYHKWHMEAPHGMFVVEK